MKCRQCLKELPVTDFYIMAGRPSGRCKECTKRDRQMTKLFHENAMVPFSEWPDILKDFTQNMADLAKQGAKIDYANSAIPSMVDRMQVSNVPIDIEALSLEALAEMIAALSSRVAALEQNISTEWLPEVREHDEEMEAQQRSNIIKALYKDSYLEDKLGPEEHAQVVDTLLEAYQSYKAQGIIPGTVLRRLCAPFQEYQCRMTPDMLVFYEKFLKPGIEATKASESYAEHAQSVEELLSLNFYDLDWTGIPYIE